MSTDNQRELFMRKIADDLVNDFRDEYDVPPEVFEAYRNGAKDAIDLLMTDLTAKEEYCELMGIRVAFID